MKEISDLLKIGLTEGEAKVYASLLELGPSSVGPITKRAKVAYSNVYEILERLLKKGIITLIIKNNVKNFQAVSPNNLSKFLDKKQEELNNQKKMLKEALPRIEELQNTYPKQEAELFIGLKGLRAAYIELFRGSTSKDENLWTYIHDKKFERQMDKFYIHEWIELSKGIKSKGLSDVAFKKSRFIKEYKKKHNIKFVDFPIFSQGEVFKDRFLLISWEEPVIAVLVTAKHVSENFRKYFYSVWDAAKK